MSKIPESVNTEGVLKDLTRIWLNEEDIWDELPFKWTFNGPERWWRWINMEWMEGMDRWNQSVFSAKDKVTTIIYATG